MAAVPAAGLLSVPRLTNEPPAGVPELGSTRASEPAKAKVVPGPLTNVAPEARKSQATQPSVGLPARVASPPLISVRWSRRRS